MANFGSLMSSSPRRLFVTGASAAEIPALFWAGVAVIAGESRNDRKLITRYGKLEKKSPQCLFASETRF